MGVESTSMNTLLDKLNAARAALQGHDIGATRAGSTPVQKPVEFSALLRASIANVDAAQNQAMGLAESFQLGDPKVTLEDTMVSLSKANISFQQMVQVRNRVIAAYHDIMNMQI